MVMSAITESFRYVNVLAWKQSDDSSDDYLVHKTYDFTRLSGKHDSPILTANRAFSLLNNVESGTLVASNIAEDAQAYCYSD